MTTVLPGVEELGAAIATEELELLAPVYPLPRLELVSGRGTRARDAAGREYLDFTCGIAVNALGHAPRGLATAVARQLGRLGHCSNLFANRPALELARQLVSATGYDRVFFCNSGAEGVDTALKFARARAHALGKPGRDVVAFRGGFHGRTGFAVSATWNPPYREPFEPLVPGVRFAEFNRADELESAIDERVCAVIVEPVQGESGAIPATREFLVAVRERTSAVGAALVLDEVQSGMGRCGYLLASEHYGVRGDLVVMSKALGGGLPLGAVLLTREVASHLAPGMHGCTFGGGAPAAAASLWILARVRRPAVLRRVRRAGEKLARGLETLVTRHSCLRETRGLGLLRAIEIDPASGIEPRALVARARERGLLLVRGGEHAVRILPPLTVKDSEIAEALARLEAAVSDLKKSGEREPAGDREASGGTS